MLLKLIGAQVRRTRDDGLAGAGRPQHAARSTADRRSRRSSHRRWLRAHRLRPTDCASGRLPAHLGVSDADFDDAFARLAPCVARPGQRDARRPHAQRTTRASPRSLRTRPERRTSLRRYPATVTNSSGRGRATSFCDPPDGHDPVPGMPARPSDRRGGGSTLTAPPSSFARAVLVEEHDSEPLRLRPPSRSGLLADDQRGRLVGDGVRDLGAEAGRGPRTPARATSPPASR